LTFLGGFEGSWWFLVVIMVFCGSLWFWVFLRGYWCFFYGFYDAWWFFEVLEFFLVVFGGSWFS
jgi:hypothetical protein